MRAHFKLTATGISLNWGMKICKINDEMKVTLGMIESTMEEKWINSLGEEAKYDDIGWMVIKVNSSHTSRRWNDWYEDMKWADDDGVGVGTKGRIVEDPVHSK